MKANYLMIDYDTVDELLDTYTYMTLINNGRDTTFKEFKRMTEKGNIQLPYKMLVAAYSFACDLYDENEQDGWNDEMYPNRK